MHSVLMKLCGVFEAELLVYYQHRKFVLRAYENTGHFASREGISRDAGHMGRNMGCPGKYGTILKLTTERHGASCGISAITELLVSIRVRISSLLLDQMRAYFTMLSPLYKGSMYNGCSVLYTRLLLPLFKPPSQGGCMQYSCPSVCLSVRLSVRLSCIDLAAVAVEQQTLRVSKTDVSCTVKNFSPLKFVRAVGLTHGIHKHTTLVYREY